MDDFFDDEPETVPVDDAALFAAMCDETRMSEGIWESPVAGDDCPPDLC